MRYNFVVLSNGWLRRQDKQQGNQEKMFFSHRILRSLPAGLHDGISSQNLT